MNDQLFTVSAEPRSSSDAAILFMVRATSHREAWATAREVCQTGNGALLREHGELVDWPIPMGRYTVKRVLASTPHRRGRPPKLTTQDLTSLAESRNVSIPPRIRRVLEELNAA